MLWQKEEIMLSFRRSLTAAAPLSPRPTAVSRVYHEDSTPKIDVLKIVSGTVWCLWALTMTMLYSTFRSGSPPVYLITWGGMTFGVYLLLKGAFGGRGRTVRLVGDAVGHTKGQPAS